MPHSILIIDDEEPIAWSLRRAFEREGYRVAVAASAEDGLAKLWSAARNLPTPSEVDAPGLWLERISLPELEEPSAD